MIIISNDLTQMVNFPTLIPECASHSLALLDLFIFSYASICSTMAYPTLGNSDHVFVSVSIDFPSNSKRVASFHCVAYDYSRADWDGLHDHLRDVPWDDIFKLSASAAASEFCEWVQIGIDVYIPHRKYQVKPHSSPWPQFIEITFFVCTNRINLLNLKESSDRLVIVAKWFLNLHMLIRQKSPSLPRNLTVGTFGELLIVLSTKVNLLYLFYSTARKCCLLHLIKQNCLPETFLRTVILMTQVSRYPVSLLELI